MENRDENCWPSRRSTKGTRRPSYTRRLKPPYSYTELIRHAILASPERALTLRQIVACLQNRFACFCGPYQGWRNSIRHNLSASNCFVKILRDFNKPNGKDNFWTLNENCSCGQCTKGLSQPVSSVGLPGPYFVDISNIHPLKNTAHFRQIPEFPSFVESPCEMESSDSKLAATETSPPLQTDINQVQIDAKETTTDGATKIADVNNNNDVDISQNCDVSTPIGVARDIDDDAALKSSRLVELKRPEVHATENSYKEKSVLLPTVHDNHGSEDKLKWHEMNFTKLEDLNFVQPTPQPTHNEEEHYVNCSNIPQHPSYFMTPYIKPGQYSYPYTPFIPQNYPGNYRMYQNGPQQEFHVAPPAYWMGNYSDPYYQSMQSTANDQLPQYQQLQENNGQYWTQL